ncbi:MAG TPA: hypothetical protein VF532_11890 [Candidatus Angelobacter sp.]
MNSIILKPGVPMRERLEEAARLWAKSGRDPIALVNGMAFFLAQCWMYASGAYQPANPSFSPEIAEYVAASKEALGGESGWNAMLQQKAWCSQCRMTFHLENLGMCTECLEYVCGACQEAHGKKCAGEVAG